MLHYPHNWCLAVVPAYNEQDSILNVIQAVREHASDFDVLVVDDGWTDDTLHFAEAAGTRVLRLPYNLGIGGAVQAGLRLLHFPAAMSRLSDQSKMITRRHGILEQRVRKRAGAQQRLPASREGEGEDASLAGWGR